MMWSPSSLVTIAIACPALGGGPISWICRQVTERRRLFGLLESSGVRNALNDAFLTAEMRKQPRKTFPPFPTSSTVGERGLPNDGECKAQGIEQRIAEQRVAHRVSHDPT